jgi:hypothetical protein
MRAASPWPRRDVPPSPQSVRAAAGRPLDVRPVRLPHSVGSGDAFRGRRLSPWTGFTRDREKKSRTVALLRFDPYRSVQGLHDAAACRQPEAAALIFRATVQTLKRFEDLLDILRRYADAVIADRECIVFSRRDAEIWISGGLSVRYLIAFAMRF